MTTVSRGIEALQRTIGAISIILLMFSAVKASVAEPVTDIRVVIDVSGSMKKNDPANLRRPALRLLVGLMPENMRSGVWTFGQYVNMQVKYGKVDSKWKSLARRESDNIHSRGLFTNIEQALQKASYNWNTPDPQYRRSLILLTDGMVDIAKDHEVNKASRQRILSKVLPRLRKAGVKVHCIALSDEVDKELLVRLSAETQGWYEQVNNAEELQRIFLRLFEKSAPVDALPIEGNRFKVDSSVKDMTLLVFRSKDGKPLRIITPDGKGWSQATHPETVKWHQEAGYDLVTVKSPQSGGWILQTKEDPDNRIMVVTNLKLKVSALADDILAGDEISIETHLEDNNKTISKASFLQLVKFGLSNSSLETGDVKTVAMLDDGQNADKKAADGVYSVDPVTIIHNGSQTFTIQAKGATFEREISHRSRYHRRAVDVSLKANESMGNYDLLIIPHIQLVKAETVQLKAKLSDATEIKLEKNAGNEWYANIAAEHAGKMLEIDFNGQRHNGKKIEASYSRKLAPLDKTTAKTEVKPEEKKSEKEDEHKTVADTEKETGAKKTSEPVVQQGHAEAEAGWMSITIMIIVSNLLLLGFIVAGYIFWKKRKAKQQAQDAKDLEL